MQRRTVTVLVLGGIWLAGGIGGRMLAVGGKPQPRRAATLPAVPAPPLKVAAEACPALSTHPEVGCDTLVTAGD